MITFQHTLSYAGDPTKTSATSVQINLQVPVFEYAQMSDASVSRIATQTSQAAAVTEALAAKSYRIPLADSFITGDDSSSLALATSYAFGVMQTGDIDALTVTAAVQYKSLDGDVLGQESIDVLVLPKITLSTDRFVAALSARSGLTKPGFFALNKSEYVSLRHQLAETSVGSNDQLLLQLISFVTSLDGDSPALREAFTVRAAQWLDLQTQATDGARVMKAIETAFDTLFDMALTIPEIVTLKVAGTFTIIAPAGTTLAAKDFMTFGLSAECQSATDSSPRILTFKFDPTVSIADGTASFSFADQPVQYANALLDPITVRVRGLDGATVWVRDFKRSEPVLSDMPISVPLQIPITLTLPPGDTQTNPALKLRGRVLTFNKDCLLKDVLVLIQTRTASDAPWRVVGAATADGSGNFALPYPYGTYAQAQAVVSLAPKDPVDIPIISNEGDQTISDNFLFLLVANPDCPPPSTNEACDCQSPNKPNRLPDFSDLISSDTYTQDIGGSCVNLSKPNRTISEFNFRAIVRISDPDVSNYTLTRVGTRLDAIDISLAASLASGSIALHAAASTAKNDSTNNYNINPSVAASYYLNAITSAWTHVTAIDGALGQGPSSITFSVLASAQGHVESVSAILEATKNLLDANDLPGVPPEGITVIESAKSLKALIALAIDTLGTSVRFELTGGVATRSRQPVGLTNPIEWQDAPEPQIQNLLQPLNKSLIKIVPLFNAGLQRPGAGTIGLKIPGGTSTPPSSNDATAEFSQAVSVATGHILHYKSLFKADGYSLGDLIYSLPLAPGQKKEIVVFDASHTLVGAETQALSQNERLSMGLVDDRDITSQVAGTLSESLRGSSNANTSGVSAGFGTGGQGSGGTGAYGGSGSAVIGVAGGVAQANANASQDSSRDVAEFFGEKLRQSIMQNAEGYRQLNASVVTTVQEGQRYGVTSEVVANHNHCHALTMMYFEVLRHYAIFQELSSVEECVFVPFLLTRFSTDNIAKWRDVLAPALLSMPSDTYLYPLSSPAGVLRPHPLLKAFDADQRIRTHYANIDYPDGAYDDERIQFIKGSVRMRVNFPRPRTRFDRILSFPIVKQLDTASLAADTMKFSEDAASYGAKAAATAGIWTLFNAPPNPPNPAQYEVMAREAIFDAFMTLDANYQTVPPAQCIRITNFKPQSSIAVGPFQPMVPITTSESDFFAENQEDKDQWTLYAKILGYSNVLTMLNAYFHGNLIAEWDRIFNDQIAPLLFEKVLATFRLSEFETDVSSPVKYRGGERLMVVDLFGTTAKKRNQLPLLLQMLVAHPALSALSKYVTLFVESTSITYSTSHFTGVLFSGGVNDDLLDGTNLPIPENPDDKRDPRREDRYLAARLLEHLNSNLEYYNKVLWRNLDPDRRYMLLDGFSIQVYDEGGNSISGQQGMRSLASVVKNDVTAVAGNSLIFPVAPGYRVNNSFIQVKSDDNEQQVTLFDHYKPLTPIEPYRISVPSKGVFAEAVQGACNACEKIETERLQDWSKYPSGDEPTAISPVNVPSPTVTDWRAAYKDFAAPIVNVQNAPAAPAPGGGLQTINDLLGKSGVFKDITGLDETQQMALKTYLSNQDNAKAFAEMAKELAMQSHNTQNSGTIMDQIDSAKNKGALSQGDYGQLVKDHLQQQIDGGQKKSQESDAAAQVIKSIPPEQIESVQTDSATVTAKPATKGTPKPVPLNVQLLANYSDGQPMLAQVSLVFAGGDKSLNFEQITSQGVTASGVAQAALALTPGHWTIAGQLAMLSLPDNFVHQIPVTIAGVSAINIDVSQYVSTDKAWRTVNGRVDIKPGMRTLDLQLTAEIEDYKVSESIQLEASVEVGGAEEIEAKLEPGIGKLITLGEVGGKISVSGKLSGGAQQKLDYDVHYSRIKSFSVTQK